jgi:hypothetical protein
MFFKLANIVILMFTTSCLLGCSPASTPPPLPEPTPSWSPTATIQVKADGNGDYSTLGEAITNAPSGAAIVLGPGRYEVEDTLLIDKSLQLLGAGMEETEITSTGLVMKISAIGNKKLSQKVL